MALIPICNIPARRTMILSALAAGTPSGAAPHGFKTRHGRGGYHTLIKQCLVLLPIDVGSYNWSCHMQQPLTSHTVATERGFPSSLFFQEVAEVQRASPNLLKQPKGLAQSEGRRK
ncbi:hypothetical protein QVD17_30649 [Tagetes erecta]|uniref:Uncharacterized protein n=1 Tax=Tagetes erecta TaxID=13708 RepID=A0AAD8NN63_TARER|nr:hypothetical protein QVD17_30649 [Tagetes erecta]